MATGRRRRRRRRRRQRGSCGCGGAAVAKPPALRGHNARCAPRHRRCTAAGAGPHNRRRPATRRFRPLPIKHAARHDQRYHWYMYEARAARVADEVSLTTARVAEFKSRSPCRRRRRRRATVWAAEPPPPTPPTIHHHGLRFRRFYDGWTTRSCDNAMGLPGATQQAASYSCLSVNEVYIQS